MSLQLIKPTLSYESSYRAYIDELGDEERYPFPLDFDHEDFPALLDKLSDFEQGINIPDGFVASSTFWLVDSDALLGVSNLRHTLNDRIRHVGGHIGLGIRPNMRGNGLSHQLLFRTIEKARELGVGDIHIHCHKGNQASEKMILGCGAELDSEVVVEGEPHPILRFILNSQTHP